MVCNNDLLEQIETLRKRMIQIAEVNGIRDETCLEISKELDQLLNTYEKEKQNT